MNPEHLRGNLDLILLSVLEREPLYGFRIIQNVKANSGGYFDFKEGSLYPALHRLEVGGLLSAEARELGRNGKPRKYYALTERGRNTLLEKRAEWAAFRDALDHIGG